MSLISLLFKRKSDTQEINTNKDNYTDKELSKLVSNKAIHPYQLDYEPRKHLENRAKFHYIGPYKDYPFNEVLDRLALSKFSYKGYLLKNRHEFLEKALKYINYDVYKGSAMPQNRYLQFSKNDCCISIKEDIPQKTYIEKSKKESVLKTQYDHLSKEIEQLFNEFNLNKDNEYVICNKSTQWDSIKPNIIGNLHVSAFIVDELRRGYESSRRLYGTYLTTKLDFIKKEYEGELHGRLGEEKVIETTNEFDNCIALHNIKLPAQNANGETYNFEIDTVLVTTRGIFILEVKNYGTVGDYELKIDSTGRWSTYYPATDTDVTRKNPNKQNNMHVINFNKFINKNLAQFNNSIDAVGVIVIGNDDVKITQENPSKNLKRVDELYNYIKEFPSNLYSIDEVNEIAKCIKDNNIEVDSVYPIDNIYEEVLSNLNFIREDLRLLDSAIPEDISYEQYTKDYENIISYLIEQEAFYEYKVVQRKKIQFTRTFREPMKGLPYTKKGIIYVYPLDILNPSSL